MYSIYKLKWLVDMLNEGDWNLDILKHSSQIYCLCDMDDNQKEIATGNLAYLTWFCMWLLY